VWALRPRRARARGSGVGPPCRFRVRTAAGGACGSGPGRHPGTGDGGRCEFAGDVRRGRLRSGPRQWRSGRRAAEL